MKLKKALHLKKLNRKVAILSVLSFSLMQPMVYADTITVSQSTTVSTDTKPVAVPSQTTAQEKPIAKITKEQATERVLSLFPRLKDATVQGVELGETNSFPPGYQNVWNINWQYSLGNSSYGFNSRVDSITGDLLQTHIGYPTDENNEAYYPAKYTKEEALKLAKTFIQKASPSIPQSSLQSSDEMRFSNQPLFGPVQYDFFFNILVNGLPSSNESLSISVDGNGEVIHYNRNIITANYPSATPKITLEEASKKFTSAVNLTLQYVPVYRNFTREKDWFLGWVPSSQGLSIDAQTGDYLNYSGDSVNPSDLKYNDVPKKDQLYTPVTGKGEDQLLTVEQAEGLVKNAALIPEGRKLSQNNLNSSYWEDRDRKVWNLSWSEQTPTGPYGRNQTSAIVDAKSGQILDYRKDDFMPPWMMPKENANDTKNAISKDKATETALTMINVLYPHASEELKLISPNPSAYVKEDGKSFNFQFQRFYKDIPVGSDVTNLVLDGSGKLITYHSSRTELIEEAVKQLKANTTKDAATASFLKNMSEKLQYSSFGGYYSEANYQKLETKLVYQQVTKDLTKIGYVIDAANGQFRATFEGNMIPNDHPMVMPKDIIGHWAQKDLEIMVQHNIISADSSGQLNPNASITLGDWMNMIAKATNPYTAYSVNDSNKKNQFQDVNEKSPYYASTQLFIQMKWLDPKKTPKLQPEQTLTREQLADSIAHIIKYNKVALYLQDKLPLSFKDTDQITQKGSVSLVAQLGLLNASEGMFNPKGSVSKADAAAVMMKLVRLQGKLDQPITR